MKILGLSCYYHDSAAALVIDNNIVAAAQEERFSRIKGDEQFPFQAIQYCLQQADIQIQDIDVIIFYEKPLLKFERIVETFLNIAPRGLSTFLTAMPSWLQKKINHKKLLKNEFKKYFNFKPEKIYFSQHHLSHAASAFFPSPFKESAVLCIDGVGEWATTSAWHGDGNQLKPLFEIKFPHSLGLFYSTFTHYCGFKINSGEYKLMGLAPFGQPEYVEIIKKNLIQLNEDGSFWLNTKYFGFLDRLVATNAEFEKLFGKPARQPNDEMSDFYKNIAASAQQVLTEAVLNLAKKIKQETQSEYLCLAGGVALNCVTNGALVEEKIFQKIWIQPAAGDAGAALGAALAYGYLFQKSDRVIEDSDSMNGAQVGPDFSSENIEKVLIKNNLVYQKLSEDFLLTKASQLLAENKVVAWFSGRMEFGPRALGARSILGNPLSADMKSVMNLKIKFRESFRPFAPIVKSESYGKYFLLQQENEYMLFISKVKHPDLMPAITHVDHSARVQTVLKNKNLRLYKLLENFEKITGHAVLVNTSFNVRGEPIVCSPQNAVDCFVNTNIDAVVLENFIVIKIDNPHINRNNQWNEQFSLD